MDSQRDNRPEAARGFLGAYWRADLAAALDFCAPNAVIVLARSLPIPTPAPVGEILPLIFREGYPRFKGGAFDVTVDRTFAEGDTVLVEYTARGKLVTGSQFECGYAAILDF